jgi:hypothetical protein
MTAAEFDSLFDLICDKVGSDYFSDPEKESFINLAQYSVIDGLLFPQRRNQEKKDNDVFEFSYQNSMVQGLSQLHLILTVAIESPQTVLFSELSTAILGDYEVTADPYKIINVTLPTDVVGGVPQWNAKFVGTQLGSNSIYKNLRFGKNTDVRYATYTIRQHLGSAEDREIFWSAPLVLAEDISVELIRTPAPFDISSSQTCEVDAIYHPEILFRALQLAGIAIRESEFYEMTNIEQTKEA